MVVYKLAHIKDGTGFERDAAFVPTTDSDFRNVLGLAIACITEGMHSDNDFRLVVLKHLTRITRILDDRE